VRSQIGDLLSWPEPPAPANPSRGGVNRPGSQVKQSPTQRREPREESSPRPSQVRSSFQQEIQKENQSKIISASSGSPTQASRQGPAGKSQKDLNEKKVSNQPYSAAPHKSDPETRAKAEAAVKTLENNLLTLQLEKGRVPSVLDFTYMFRSRQN
jgi:hypothetical protein